MVLIRGHVIGCETWALQDGAQQSWLFLHTCYLRIALLMKKYKLWWWCFSGVTPQGSHFLAMDLKHLLHLFWGSDSFTNPNLFLECWVLKPDFTYARQYVLCNWRISQLFAPLFILLGMAESRVARIMLDRLRGNQWKGKRDSNLQKCFKRWSLRHWAFPRSDPSAVT